MTENEKIELFDKWYDENYDEWAEGEEGIAEGSGAGWFGKSDGSNAI